MAKKKKSKLPNPMIQPMFKKPPGPKTKTFKQGDIVRVLIRGGNKYYTAIVLEVDRIKKGGRKYDIVLTDTKTGQRRYAQTNWCRLIKTKKKKVAKEDTARVHDPMQCLDRTVIPPAATDRPIHIREFLETLPDNGGRKLPMCETCRNGPLFVVGGKALIKTKLDDFFRLDRLASYKHFILVPKKIFLGRVGRADRKKTTMCNRCKGGHYIKISGKEKQTGVAQFSVMDHVGLSQKGYIALITVS